MSLQRTPEWYASRIGKVTASRVADVVAKLKSGGWGAQRANYLYDLVTERISGVVEDSYVSAAMQHGIDCEPQARAAYEFYSDRDVGLAAFVDHPKIAWSGASPDGYVGEDGLVEFKCCQNRAHLEFIRRQKPEDRYEKQIAWQLACTGRQWCDLAYFNPRMPSHLQLHVVRLRRNDGLIDELEREVSIFLEQVAAEVRYYEKFQPVSVAA